MHTNYGLSNNSPATPLPLPNQFNSLLASLQNQNPLDSSLSPKRPKLDMENLSLPSLTPQVSAIAAAQSQLQAAQAQAIQNAQNQAQAQAVQNMQAGLNNLAQAQQNAALKNAQSNANQTAAEILAKIQAQNSQNGANPGNAESQVANPNPLSQLAQAQAAQKSPQNNILASLNSLNQNKTASNTQPSPSPLPTLLNEANKNSLVSPVSVSHPGPSNPTSNALNLINQINSIQNSTNLQNILNNLNPSGNQPNVLQNLLLQQQINNLTQNNTSNPAPGPSNNNLLQAILNQNQAVALNPVPAQTVPAPVNPPVIPTSVQQNPAPNNNLLALLNQVKSAQNPATSTPVNNFASIAGLVSNSSSSPSDPLKNLLNSSPSPVDNKITTTLASNPVTTVSASMNPTSAPAPATTTPILTSSLPAAPTAPSTSTSNNFDISKLLSNPDLDTLTKSAAVLSKFNPELSNSLMQAISQIQNSGSAVQNVNNQDDETSQVDVVNDGENEDVKVE